VTISTAGAALIDDADASAQRTTLGLGTISTQNANAVSITGGSITGITDLAVADGGTGASDAATARTNLGVGTLGTQNANAVAITGGTIVANASGISIRDADASNVMTIAVGSNLTANTVLTLTTSAASNRTLDISASNVTVSVAGAALIDDADASAQRTTLGLGTIATQDANAVSITGGSITGVTDMTVSDGGTGVSSFTAYSVIAGGTTSTSALQSVSGLGSSGDVLTSNGAAALPTWQAASGVPVASVIPYAGTSAPTGWLLCFGQAISRATYAALFAVVGTTYGSGDGSTTFNLPDLRGRVVAGEDDMGGTSANRLTGLSGGVDGDILGAAGGAETHTLTTAELASHSHPAFYTSDTGGGATGVIGTSIQSANYTANTASSGSSTAHNNVQPTFILNYIIKT
jgi:microcystin-dependent protein